MSDGGQSPNRRAKRSPSVNFDVNLDDMNTVYVRKNFEAGEKLLFEQFEGVAASVTKLYHTPSWPIFQKAAAAVTQFYKDSVESYRRGYESGVGLGRQLLCKELLASLQLSAHPYLRRDDCVDLILARTSSSNVGGGPYGSQTVPPGGSPPAGLSFRMSPPRSAGQGANLGAPFAAEATQTDQFLVDPGAQTGAADDELAIFQEALNSRPQGLTAFYVEERRRHAKRRRDDDDDQWTARKRNRRNY